MAIPFANSGDPDQTVLQEMSKPVFCKKKKKKKKKIRKISLMCYLLNYPREPKVK